MTRSAQLPPSRHAELRGLIAGGCSHLQAAQQMGVSIGAVSWRCKTLGIESAHSHTGKSRDPRRSDGTPGLRKDVSEFSGQETRYCMALDGQMPAACAAKLAGFEAGVPAGVYRRWKERKGRQL